MGGSPPELRKKRRGRTTFVAVILEPMTSANPSFREARDLLVDLGEDYFGARSAFVWPRPEKFNWALDWFEAELAAGEHGRKPALKVIGDSIETRSFADLARASSRLANGLRALGAARGDRLVMMLGNEPELWETMLAAMKLGVVLIPAMPQLGPADIADRLDRGRAKFIVARGADAEKFAGLGAEVERIAIGEEAAGWRPYASLMSPNDRFRPDGPTRADDPMLLYFTSGTTARPKLVLHTHATYPIGHLSTMFGLGLRPGDVHLNIASPGWAKHAWSSVFAPWNAGATIVALAGRFDVRETLDILVNHEVTVFCAPPTVWRMLIQEDLGRWKIALREANSAGEPLNPEVIDRVRRAWGLTVRDSYGQTETTMMIGNSPGQKVVAGSMGRALPGWRIALLDADGLEADQGEISLMLHPRPAGLMRGYLNETGEAAPEGDYYRTGDVASRDAEGYITYIGRADDVFKSSDFRLSPFELESALIEHAAVAEAAVVPAPDAMRHATAKAYITLASGWAADEATAASIFEHVRRRLSAYKRVRRIEFAELPKTASGKIRRVELRVREKALAERDERAEREFRIEDFPEG